MVTGYDSLKVEVAENQDPIQTVSPTWTDVTTMTHTLTTNRGRDNFWDSYSPGSASFTFNGDFYNDILVVPNTLIRVSANDSTSTRKYLFTGFLRPQQGYVVDWAYNVSSTTLQALDFLALMSEQNFGTAGSYDVLSGTLLTQLAYPPGHLFPLWQTESIDPGHTIMQNGPSTSGTYLDVFQNIAFAEGGAFYILGDGTVNFDDRMAIGSTSRIATNQVTFDGTGAGDSSYATNWSLYQPPVYTTATVTRANDDSLTIIQDGVPKQVPQPFTFSSPTQIALYGTSAFPPVTNALMSSNTEAAALAERIVMSTHNVWPCPQTIRLFPRRDDAQLNASVRRELRDRALFKNALAAPSGLDVWVERIQHSIDCGSKTWTCDLSFTSRDQVFEDIDPSLWFVLDDATDGLLDGSRLLGW